MQLSSISYAAISFLSLLIVSAPASFGEDLRVAPTVCQGEFGATPTISVQRLSLPFVKGNRKRVALAAVIPDFDRTRDVVIGVRPSRHTYLINGLVGRHDPGKFGGRGKFRGGARTLSPGLIIRLRLSPPTVQRIAVEMKRVRGNRNLTCTHTTAGVLARAGVPGMHSFIFTPRQMLRGFGRFDNVDARLYLINSDADGLKEFEDQVKVINAKKPPPPPPRSEDPRRRGTDCCEDSECSNSSMIACLDADCCVGASPSGECACGESECSESGACDCGGSDSDSDCCN